LEAKRHEKPPGKAVFRFQALIQKNKPLGPEKPKRDLVVAPYGCQRTERLFSRKAKTVTVSGFSNRSQAFS